MKTLIKQLLREGLLKESKASETQTLGVLKRKGDESPEETLNKLKQLDNSSNQINLPAMAYLLSPNVNTTDLKSVFDDYNELVNKKRVKPIQATKKGLMLGDKTFTDCLRFS